VADPDNINAEFAIIIRSDLKGQGLGQMLMTKLITYFRQRGTQVIVGEVLSDNHALIELAKNLGFQIASHPGTGTIELRLPL
jgi:acetyltransferase